MSAEQWIVAVCREAERLEQEKRPLTEEEVRTVTVANFLRQIAPYAVPPPVSVPPEEVS